MKTIFTIGHSTLEAQRLVAALEAFGVEQVVDVRSVPFSRRYPWWSRQEMEKALPASGIGYLWLGDLLGGLRREGYVDFMETPGFAAGLSKLIEAASERPTAFLCAEKDFRKCHRRYIAEALVKKGWDVRHIVDERTAEPHPRSLL